MKKEYTIWNEKDYVRICKKEDINFRGKIKRKQDKNLQMSPHYLNVKSGLIIKIPLRSLNSFGLFKSWLEYVSGGWVEGEYWILGRSKDAGRVNNIFQIPVVKFYRKDGDVFINLKSKRTKRKRWGEDKQTSRKFEIFELMDNFEMEY